MRIAVVIYAFSENRGGAERAAFNFVKDLRQRGHEVHVYAHKVSDSLQSMEKFQHTIPVTSFYSPLKHLTFASNARKMLEKENYDIIHSFSRTYFQDVLRLGGGLHIEYLKQTHPSGFGRLLAHLNPRERAILKCERRSFAPEASKMIAAVSNRCKEELLNYFPVPEEKIRVIHNGVDIRRFHPENKARHRRKVRQAFGIGDSEFVLLFVGTGLVRKGLAFALESLALIPPEIPMKLLVIGRDDVSPFRAMVRKFRLKDRAFFIGPRDNVPEFYGAADALVLPSLYDPFPNVCLEAMATGVPVIVSQITGVAELIKDGYDSMVLSDPRDVVALSQKIRALMDRDLLKAMSDRARQVAEQHSLEKNTEAYLDLYHEVLKRKHG